MITSTYPATNGVQTMSVSLDDRLVTLAEVFADAGFYTGAIISNVRIGTPYNFLQGFHDVCETWDHGQGERRKNTGTSFWSNEEITRKAVSWLGEHHRKPFFLWVHFLDPHGPYLPPEDLASRFVGDEIWTKQPNRAPPGQVASYQKVAKHETIAEFVAGYDAEIVSTDRAVGAIMDECTALGLRDNSLVVITADHGESLGEHNYYFKHGRYIYEACTRVPLIFHAPGQVPSRRRVDTPVALVDVVPTVLDLMGVHPDPPIAQFQGRSLVEAFGDESIEHEPVFIQSRKGQFAVRSRQWKFIYIVRSTTEGRESRVGEQLYDLRSDPMETRNLIKKLPAIATELRSVLTRWRTQMQDIGLVYEGRQVPNEELDSVELDQLRSLGYIGGPDDG